MATFLDGTKPEVILNAHDSAQWGLVERTVLESILDFRPEIHWTERSRLVSTALTKSVPPAGQSRDPQDFLRALGNAENGWVRRKKTKYILATDLFATLPSSVKWRRIGGVRVRLAASHSASYDRAGALRDAESEGYIRPGRWPAGTTAIRIHVDARSEIAAGYVALDGFDLLRGLWSLAHRSRRLSFGGIRHPLGDLRSGLLHTLHDAVGQPLYPHGKGGARQFWYDSGFAPPPSRATDLRKRWPRLERYERAFRARLRKIRYADRVEDAILGYVRALDETDVNPSFLKMWSVFEQLASGGQRKRQTQLVERAMFRAVEKHEPYLHQELEALRRFRNQIAHQHSVSLGHDGDSPLQALAGWVERLIYFHIFSVPPRTSFPDAGQLLDLPRTRRGISTELRKLTWARKARERMH